MSGSQVFAISKLVAAHGGRWLALVVHERDENGWPTRAELIATAGSRLELREQVKDRDRIYFKYAGPITPNQEYGFIY